MSLPLLALFLGGVFGGFFGAMVGSAGLVSIPLLILLGQSPHLAVATSRPAGFVLELVSALRYLREGKLTPLLLRRAFPLCIAAAIGGVLGAIIVAGVDDQTLRLLFSIIISSMFVFLLVKKDWGGVERPQLQRHQAWLALCTFLMSIYGGFFGFTFGTLITFVLVSFGYTLVQSAAMGRTIGACTTLTASIVFLLSGSVNIPYAIALSIGFGIGAWTGAGVGARKGNGYIKTLLSLVVVAAVVKLLYDFTTAG